MENLTVEEIKKFAKQQHARIMGYYDYDNSKRMNLPMTVKIMEELGELCDDVLAHSGLQRKDKLEKLDKENLSEEFADVIFTTFILAENMGIDLEAGMKRKIQKIEARGGV